MSERMSERLRLQFESDIVPIELRPGRYVRIQGLPWDLTKAEAEKVAAVIEAMAVSTPAASEGD